MSPLRTLGPYKLDNPWILAPMAGVSEMPFRLIARRMGAALAPTELISAKGLTYKNERTEKYLRHHSEEKPFSVQLFGGEVDSMVEAAQMACDAGADIIDINMGCPVKKVTKTGAGSALLCDPVRAAHMVEAIKKRVPVPVTCKIRAGWDATHINCVEMAHALQDAGAAAIALHARTRAQGYTGHANWEWIAALRPILTHSLLIGNGDVTNYQEATRMLQETGADAVMIGRAALGNPWIFQHLHHPELPAPTPEEKQPLILQHLREQIAFVGEELRAMRQMREQLIWYSRGLRHAKLFREQVIHVETYAQAARIVETFFVSTKEIEEKAPITVLDAEDVNYKIAFG